MELIKYKQTVLNNKPQNKTIQETIIKNEATKYVVVNISLRNMR